MLSVGAKPLRAGEPCRAQRAGAGFGGRGKSHENSHARIEE